MLKLCPGANLITCMSLSSESSVWSLLEMEGFSALWSSLAACGDIGGVLVSLPFCPLSSVLGLFSSLLLAKETSPLRSLALADPGGYIPPGVSPLMAFRDEALLEEVDEDEESEVRLLSALRDLRHCSGSSLFLGPPLPLRWLLLNWLISFPTDTMESVSTEFGDLPGRCRPEGGVWVWATSLCSTSRLSAGRGILGLFPLGGTLVRPGWATEEAGGGTTRFRLLLSGS